MEIEIDYYALKKSKEAEQVTCPKCNKGKLKQRAGLRFFTIFYFPVIPLSTFEEVYCNRCRKPIERSQLRQKVIPNIHYFSKFIGLFLGVIVLAFWLSSELKQKRLEMEYLLQPKRHDVWIVNEAKLTNEKSQQTSYKVLQVTSVNSGQVIVKNGRFTYTSLGSAIKAIRLDNLMLDAYFNKKPLIFNQDNLVKLKTNEIIYSAHRPKNLSLFGGLVMMPTTLPSIKPIHQAIPLNQEAIALYQNGEYLASVELFKKAAEQGDAWAQYNLGEMYLKGQGIEKNTELAQQYLKQSANQGNQSALALLKQ